MNKVKLDHLLDEDCLTPAQKRAVRRLLYYKIKKIPIAVSIPNTTGEVISLHYVISNSDGEKGFYLEEETVSDLKENMYKPMMFHLISVLSEDVGNPHAIEKIKGILIDGSFGESTNKQTIRFKDTRFQSNHHQFIKAQALFETLKVILGLK